MAAAWSLTPGWYRSPDHLAAHGRPAGTVLRWWDGTAWTHHVELPETVAPGVPTAALRAAPDERQLMRNRILSIIAALAVLLGGGLAIAQFTGSASAAPVRAASFGPGNVIGALVPIRTDAPRGDYLDANGIPHCLPAGPNSTVIWATGDYPGMSWHGANPDCLFGPAAATTPVDTTPAVKRETNIVVNVDFDATKPISVTGLPPYRAGSPELWGDNTGSISDAAADIVVLRANTATTDCGALDLGRGLANVVRGNGPSGSVIGDATVAASARQVGSTVQKFCVYPRHISATTTTGGSGPIVWSEGFLAGQSWKLNVWVYAP